MSEQQLELELETPREIVRRLGNFTPVDLGRVDALQQIADLTDWAYAAQDVIARLLMKIEGHQ